MDGYEENILKLRPTIIKVDTTKTSTGSSDVNSITIPVRNLPTRVYKYIVDWGDGNVTYHSSGVTSPSRTYVNGGEKIIKIYGQFAGFWFNNIGDCKKLIEVQQEGNVVFAPDQENAFYGCSNITVFNMALKNLTNGNIMFNNSSVSTLSPTMTFPNLTIGTQMFQGSKLTTVPIGTTFNSLINGWRLFQGSELSYLPEGVTFANTTDVRLMFSESKLSSIPNSISFNHVTNGYYTFYRTLIKRLPDTMLLPNLTNGDIMFNNSLLEELPSSMTLDNLTIGTQMFQSTKLTTLPIGITLRSLTDGWRMFEAVTLNTSRYSQLLIDMNTYNTNNNVRFHGGFSKYNSTAVSARASLISRGWTITDGGLE